MDGKITSKKLKNLFAKNPEYSQSGLSRKCGISKSTVSKWVNGHMSINQKYHNDIIEYFYKDKNILKVSKKSLVNEKETKKGNDDTSKENHRKPQDVASKYILIRDDLAQQLESQGKYGNHYEDLIDHAVYLFELKDELQNDIKTNGLRIVASTGNGFEKTTDNASVRNINNVSSQLLRVLKSLGLDEPDVEDFDEDAL